MDEARAVLDRLARIAALDRAGAGPHELVPELRALVAEATAWSGAEGGEAGRRAVEELRAAVGSVEEVTGRR